MRFTLNELGGLATASVDHPRMTAGGGGEEDAISWAEDVVRRMEKIAPCCINVRWHGNNEKNAHCHGLVLSKSKLRLK